MANRSLAVVSMGRRYLFSSFVYIGLALIMMSAIHEPQVAFGDCDAKNPCGAGEICCQGTCISDTNICCDDGTYGPSDTCTCCTGCTEACSSPSTIACEEP